MVCCHQINALINVSSIEELWGLHTQQMASYGFDRILYGFTHYRTSTSLGDPDDFIVLTNHDREYTDLYMGEGLYAHAPMVRWALEHEGACSWSVLDRMLDEGVLNDCERRVIEFNHSQGVKAGYSISFKSISKRTKGAIALTGRRGLDQAAVDAIWKEHGQDIMALNNIVHLRIQTLPYSTEKRSLTRRQREVLGWVGDGKTIQDIALLLSLNPATVEKHLRLAREALGVETTAQAVLKAAFQNQMFVLDL
ncbi:MAG TPA: LuxR family transcriptional regulator [Roseovarius sp.]|nr:LuxR family transcriptional regulator [Roseovarius sp.]